MTELLKTSKKHPPLGNTNPEKQLGLTREQFVEDCIKLDRWHKRAHKFSFQPYQPIGEDYMCSTLTIAQQFHNTLNRLRECWTDKIADQLFWELQVKKIRDHAVREFDLTDVMVSTTYEDDIYLLNDKIVMMRPSHKASSPETWAYVVMHEIGHHVINRNRSAFKYSIGNANQRAFFSNPAAQKTKTYQVSLFEVETVAWHEGYRLAKEIGVHLVDSNFDKVKTNCLLSYAVLE